jgi:hypothetical protein
MSPSIERSGPLIAGVPRFLLPSALSTRASRIWGGGEGAFGFWSFLLLTRRLGFPGLTPPRQGGPTGEALPNFISKPFLLIHYIYLL